MYYIIFFIIIFTSFIFARDEFPQRLPNVRSNYRAGDLIQYEDANHLGRTVNALCEKVGIDNSHLYGNRFTNTLDYKIFRLWYNAISNNLKIHELTTLINNLQATSGGNTSNFFLDFIYITKSPLNTNKSVGLRLYYSPHSYLTNWQIGYQFYVFEDIITPSVTNLVLVNEFENEMRFYGYSSDDSELVSNRNRDYLLMKLVAPSTNPDGSVVGGGAYFGRGIILDDRGFITNRNNYFSIREAEKWYYPIETTSIYNQVTYHSGNITNWYGSFLIFQPKPQGIYNKIPVGYEFVDDEGFPVFTVRGFLNLSGWITNVYQYWVANFHFIKVTGIPEPQEHEFHNAVPLGFLNKEFDRRIRLYQMNILGFDPRQGLIDGRYIQYYDKNYFNTLCRIFVNPIINTSITINTSGSNIVMNIFSTQNNPENILITYAGSATNSYWGGRTTNSYNVHYTFCGVMLDPYNVIPNIYGIKSRTEFTGVAEIPRGRNSVIVTVNPFVNEFGQTIIPNIVVPNASIIITPYRTPLHLMYYWVEYVSNNAFRISIDAPQKEPIVFKWCVPHVLTASYSTIDYPKDKVISGPPVVIPRGQTVSDFVRVANTNWFFSNNDIVLFTPLDFPTNNLGQTNLVCWYQQRSFYHNSPARVVIDTPTTKDLKFNWVIFKR